MATFKSKAFIGGVPFRPTEEGPFEVTASILVPNGTAIAANDVFKFMLLGADVDVREVTFRCDDLDTATGITLHGGVDYAGGTTDDPDAFFASSTIGQTGGQVRVENGGDDPFAVGAFIPLPGTATITVTCAVAPTGNPTTDRYLTMTVKGGKRTGATSDVPYVYADRYSSAGVGTI
jgi:hypothetical protein